MKVRFKFFILLSAFAFLPFTGSGQPDIKDSLVRKDKDQRGITWRTDTSRKDTAKTSMETLIIPEARPSEPVEKKNMPTWLWIVIGFIPGFLAGSFLVFQFSKSRIYSILAAEKNKYLDRLKEDKSQGSLMRELFKHLGIISLLKHSKDEKKRAVRNLTNDFAQLKKENERLITEIEQKDKTIADQKSNADIHGSAAEHTEKQAGLSGKPDKNSDIYFTIPESDGSFKASTGKDWQDIDCFYKIMPEKEGQAGKLYFISGDYDLRALDNIDYYINPVCEIQNITDRSFARKIVMTDPGIVIKRGDCWKIDENFKVKIKLV